MTPGAYRADRGETLVEGLVAIGIIGTVVVALVGLVGTAMTLTTVRDAQARSEVVTRAVYESVSAYHPVQSTPGDPVPLDCSVSGVRADIARLVEAVPVPEGITVAAPVVRAVYVPPASPGTVSTVTTSAVPCPASDAPAGSTAVGLAVTVSVTASGAGRKGGTWSNAMTAQLTWSPS